MECDNMGATTAAGSDLDYAVEKSMRYHQRRRGFYDLGHKAIMFFILILGSAAFSRILVVDLAGFGDYLVAVAVLLAALDLVWNPSHRARDHEMLFRRFGELAREIRTSEPNGELQKKWEARRIEIESDEPPIYWSLEADCDNEVRRAWGRNKTTIEIPLWYRLTRNFLRHETRHYKEVEAKP